DQDAVGENRVAVLALVVGGTFGVLMLGLRSPLVALKAVGLNLLSVAAAMGVAALVFQHPEGARLVGLDGPLDGLFPAVPILVFCVVFGVSIDYEVFLVARVREPILAGIAQDEAIARALDRTRGGITSAAVVMIAAF